jgi:hypothetical protein
VLAENEEAVVQFLKANPEKLQQFQAAWNSGLYGMAYDWAANEYQQAMTRAGQAPPPAAPNRLDGMMPPPGQGRSLQDPTAMGEQVAMEQFRRTGRPESIIKHRLNTTQGHHFQRGIYGS